MCFSGASRTWQMLSDAALAISAQHLYKRFPLAQGRKRLREAFERRLYSGAPHPAGHASLAPWALRDVSLEVQPGEQVGLIGHNGAGKSVLLRILARVTRPTQGEAVLRGSVGAVLEVGAGFNRELTGRENIYLQGAVLGMARREVARKFDDIVAFSELAPFLDAPLKTYSNGMQVRLAFAVAAQLEPDILLLDEVLAVADADFITAAVEQLHRMARDGRTLLLAGHDLDMLAQVCARMIWLEQGKLVRVGQAASVLADYRAHLASVPASNFATPGRRTH